MYRTMLLSKIHRATVTETHLDYVGSITIDGTLLDEAGIYENEKVEVFDIDNGNRFQTYTLRGEPGSGGIGVNGAAARMVDKGDKIIIVNYGHMLEDEMKTHRPKVIVVDGDNNIARHEL
ncbi:MAG: aspartate 1-decarboxylase [Candidatus Cloacimonetes bacterium]|nr:aspartate 1-decarboxylase [Candidatus Cloacimonadota bacterium]